MTELLTRILKAAEYELPCIYGFFQKGEQKENARLQPIIKAQNDALRAMSEALEKYKSCGDDNDKFIDICLERAIELRETDNVTINPGGKFIAEPAVKALTEAEQILEKVGRG